MQRCDRRSDDDEVTVYARSSEAYTAAASTGDPSAKDQRARLRWCMRPRDLLAGVPAHRAPG